MEEVHARRLCLPYSRRALFTGLHSLPNLFPFEATRGTSRPCMHFFPLEPQRSPPLTLYSIDPAMGDRFVENEPRTFLPKTMQQGTLEVHKCTIQQWMDQQWAKQQTTTASTDNTSHKAATGTTSIGTGAPDPASPARSSTSTATSAASRRTVAVDWLVVVAVHSHVLLHDYIPSLRRLPRFKHAQLVVVAIPCCVEQVCALSVLCASVVCKP